MLDHKHGPVFLTHSIVLRFIHRYMSAGKFVFRHSSFFCSFLSWLSVVVGLPRQLLVSQRFQCIQDYSGIASALPATAFHGHNGSESHQGSGSTLSAPMLKECPQYPASSRRVRFRKNRRKFFRLLRQQWLGPSNLSNDIQPYEKVASEILGRT
jgi:hypothetical protein